MKDGRRFRWKRAKPCDRLDISSLHANAVIIEADFILCEVVEVRFVAQRSPVV
jgi:hypothetical protein